MGTVPLICLVGVFIFGTAFVGSGSANLLTKALESDKLNVVNKNIETNLNVDIALIVLVIIAILFAAVGVCLKLWRRNENVVARDEENQ